VIGTSFTFSAYEVERHFKVVVIEDCLEYNQALLPSIPSGSRYDQSHPTKTLQQMILQLHSPQSVL
jgi:hypothetical protein